MILNVVHPYTYKLKGDALGVGTCEKTRSRDQGVVSLIEKTLDSGGRVVAHQRFDERGEVVQRLQRLALELDPVFKPLFDKRAEWIATTRYGLPIEDEKPKAVSRENWKRILRCMITRSRLGAVLGESEPLMFIGGALENCVTNAAHYSREVYRKNGEDIFYVPELCATFDPVMRERASALLREKGVIPISPEEAMLKIAEK